MRDEVGLRSHTRGTVGISTRGRDTGDAQIWLNLVDNPRLDHDYTVFGRVAAGAEVLQLTLSMTLADGSPNTPENAVAAVKAVLGAVGLPLIVFGPGNTELDNAFSRRVRYIVLETGPAKLKTWKSEKRDVIADFKKLFGAESPKVPPIMGIAIGAGYLFPTTFQNEVYSDLTGERGILMGALAGVMEAQYRLLRKHGHSPSEAFNETVEELTQSLIRLVAENGMDWMYSNCSATAQRGALDWKDRFRDAVVPVFKDLYDRVASGKETEVVLTVNSAPDYREKLQKELDAIKNSEMWQAGAAVRSLRPERRKK